MVTDAVSEQKKTPRGRVQFESQGNGKTIAVHLDRMGFRRLLETLERLAETGGRQAFEKSGRARPDDRNDGADKAGAVTRLMFHIEDEGGGEGGS